MQNLARALIVLSAVTGGGTANADWTANIGWASEYHFRGIFQKTSSANGGVDFSKNGFYAGTWAADVGDGLEVDGYGGYSGEVGPVSLGVGFTGYYYTGDFDDTYEEINFNGGFGIAMVDVAVGKHDTFGGPEQKYTYYALTLQKEGFYAKYAGFARDFAGEYIELGYSKSLEQLDVGLYLVLANEDLVGERDESIVFTVGKTFEF